MSSRERPRLVRCLDQPLLRVGGHPSIGQNINGPCVVRVPSWVPDPLGRFYMYFAHHTGAYIRLAASDDLMGPWRVADTPPLHLSQTRFAQAPVTHHLRDGDQVTEPAHIASPDVHVLAQERRFLMFFHGLCEDGSQTTRIAVSADGLKFTADDYSTDVAPPYLRICRADDRFIGVSWGGELFTACNQFGPFEKGPALLARPNGPGLVPRHPALVWKNEQLHVFYSLIGDCPEKLWHIAVSPGPSWQDWRIGEPSLILSPETVWEGSQMPEVPSKIGAAKGLENALRDPFVFENCLFYSGGGESCIAVARIHWALE